MKGVDYSRACYLFSGQGAAIPGMFQYAYQKVGVIRQRFDEADALAHRSGLPPPSLYITDSQAIPTEDLVITRNLAAYTMQVALFDHLLTCRPPPTLLTGSSQGEYASLVCSGVTDFATLFEVNIARHKICGPTNALGFLVAVAASPTAIASVLDGHNAYLSIINSPERSVVAVPPEELAEVQDILRLKGIGAKVLEVPHPYHSPLMQSASERFHSWLENYGLLFQPPQIAVLSSVSRALITTGLSSSEAALHLSRQLTEQVDFPCQIEMAYAMRSFAFLELGSGATLGTFVRKSLGALEHKILDLDAYLPTVLTDEAPKAKLDKAQTRIFGALRKAVAKLTGYEIESILIEDRFQEDLAIDSLKKVEILVEVIQEIDPGRMELGELPSAQRLSDVVRVFSLPPAQNGLGVSMASSAQFGRYAVILQDVPLVFDHAHIPARWKVVQLKALTGHDFKFTDDLDGAGLVLVADSNTFSSQNGKNGYPMERIECLLDLFQSFKAFLPWLAENDFDLTLATSGDSHPFAQGLSGFFKSMQQECPKLGFKHLHFLTLPSQEELIRLADAERGTTSAIDIHYESGRRQVVVLEPLEDTTVDKPAFNDAVIIAFGGAKGISHALLTRLAATGQPHLYLAGRSPREVVAQALGELERLTPHVHYTVLDAQDPEATGKLFADIHNKHGRVDFVVNAVGIEKSRLLANKSKAEMHKELNSKVVPTINILNAAQTVSAGLVLNFGSVASRWGNAGQTIYACAGDIVNQLSVSYNRMLGHIGAVTIEWPPWDGIGMTADPAVLHQLRRRGLSLLGADRAAELLSSDLRCPRHDVVVYTNPNDMHLIAAATVDRRADRALVGERGIEGGYRRVLDRKRDLWLDDHMIDGISYLPAAAAVTMAFALNLSADLGIHCIEDFQMLQPVVLRDEPVTLLLEFEKQDSAIGLRGRSSVVHFRCQFRNQEMPPTSFYDGSKAVRSLDPGRLYRDGLLFHGAIFQVLHQLQVMEDGTLEASIDSARLKVVYGMDYWDRLTQWLDGAFQLLALTALLDKSVMAIPVGIKRVIMQESRTHTPYVKVILRKIKFSDGEVMGDVVLLDEGSSPILVLEGVRLKVLRPALGDIALDLLRSV
jgi:malonyl CoA-acyl carrier protein transacylase/NAD(P)-dependent dehydrogenase (short-subunit alcohol dehydrogenase family)